MKSSCRFIRDGATASTAICSFGAEELCARVHGMSEPAESVTAPPSPREARSLGAGRYITDGKALGFLGAKIS